MNEPHPQSPARAPWRERWRVIIFGYETAAGRLFDVVLLIVILLSVLTVLLERVQSIREVYGPSLRLAERVFTILFAIEYIARLATAADAARYARSFFGIVDFLAVGPVYLSLLFGLSPSLAVLRSLRLMRVFRILKLTRFIGEAATLRIAIVASLRKITVFLFAVITIVVIVGALMYQIEGEKNGITSIPAAMYWAVVTVTTVGYGDISPHTVPGRLLASVLMIRGYGIIAVPTGIFSFELARATGPGSRRKCTACGLLFHDQDALHCKNCGAPLPGVVVEH